MEYDEYIDYLKDQADAAEEDANNRSVEEERDRECIRTLTAKRDSLSAEVERLNGQLQRGERCVGKLRELAHDLGWDGVNNSKILEVFLEQIITAATARAEAAESRLRDLAIILNPHEPYDATKITGWARDTVERAEEADQYEELVAVLRVALDTARGEVGWIIRNTEPLGTDSGDLATNRAAMACQSSINAALALTPASAGNRIKAKVLRDAANNLHLRFDREALLDEADRLDAMEKEEV